MHQNVQGRQRVVIERVEPEIDCGSFPVKRTVGESLKVNADIFADGHDQLSASLLFRKKGQTNWRESPMHLLVNDRWQGTFMVQEIGIYEYTVFAWINHFQTWQADLQKKFATGQDLSSELSIGAQMIDKAMQNSRARDKQRLTEYCKDLKEHKDSSEAVSLACSPDLTQLMQRYQNKGVPTYYSRILTAEVDRNKAACSAWYEFFPRSWGTAPGEHGNFRDCLRLLPEIARMGFDVIYLPPIHPIGQSKRKGRNNNPVAEEDAPGSPWAIGSSSGGHKAIHPELGTFEDFRNFQARAREMGLELALDLTFQCSNDHPYLKEHPEWFLWRPDGSVQFAENPPKKYEDVVPFNFACENWPALWEELKSIVVFWIKQGISIFRVDNPHTKPFVFWEWLISEIKKEYPETLFLAEAFTRPKVMYRLAKIGFTQSYTYFTWRNSKQELTEYVQELINSRAREFFRPNFWPNTPDILPEILQHGGRPAFILRFALAATLSSNYGIYGPAFELCISEAIPGKEEYLNSEKYEIKDWDWDQEGNLKDFIARINQIRRENPALQDTYNLRFQDCDNNYILFFSKHAQGSDNYLLITINLDPFHTQSGWIRVPLEELGIAKGDSYLLQDLVGGEKHVWSEEWNQIELNPHITPVRIFHVHSHLRRENDFDYFM